MASIDNVTLDTAANVNFDGQVTSYAAGKSFSVPGDSSFGIEVLETRSYVCNYG